MNKMKYYIKITNIRLIISYVLIFVGSVNQAKSVLIKSEVNDEEQGIDVYFTEKVLCPSEVEEVCGKNFDLKAKFNHDGIYRQVSYPELTEIIEDSLEYKGIKTPSNIIFNFYNVSNKNQLSLLKSYILKFNNILNNIYNDNSLRIKTIDIKYYYFDDPTSPYQIYQGRWGWTKGTDKPKRELEEVIDEFKELKLKITNKREEKIDKNIEAYKQDEFIEEDRCWVTNSTFKYGNSLETMIKVHFSTPNPYPNIKLQEEREITLGYTDGSLPEVVGYSRIESHKDIPQEMLTHELYNLLYNEYYEGNLEDISIHFYGTIGLNKAEEIKNEICGLFYKDHIYNSIEFVEKIFKTSRL